MSLMLCRQEPVNNPYYIEPLGIRIWSSQELCYVIYHNPLLVMDGFVDEHLIAFIRAELDMEFLASKLEKWIVSKEDKDQLLFIILSECGYYPAAEQTKFRQKVAALRKLPQAEYIRQKGDYMFGRKQYGKAAAIYEKVLELPGGGTANKELTENIWCRLGCTYARMFQFSKAWMAFEKAYQCRQSQEILKRMYYLTRMGEESHNRHFHLPPITDDQKAAWEQDISEAGERAKASDSILKLEGLFQKDSIKRPAGALKLIKQWKQEYRGMI